MSLYNLGTAASVQGARPTQPRVKWIGGSGWNALIYFSLEKYVIAEKLFFSYSNLSISFDEEDIFYFFFNFSVSNCGFLSSVFVYLIVVLNLKYYINSGWLNLVTIWKQSYSNVMFSHVTTESHHKPYNSNISWNQQRRNLVEAPHLGHSNRTRSDQLDGAFKSGQRKRKHKIILPLSNAHCNFSSTSNLQMCEEKLVRSTVCVSKCT